MRKHQQRQIFAALASIKEAQSAGLYADCQAAVLSLAGFIDSIEGKGTETVMLLEKYYEFLSGTHNGELSKKTLQKHLVKIENSIKHELRPNKIEIVFFPYKASMFDCFESIWLAAKDDSACDAYIVPVPYFDLTSERKLGQIHYEGNQYPDDIKVTAWQTYNVQSRRPDVIFIHNPYDLNNLITCVHPNFHAERLKNFTDMLVYIPYFASCDDVAETFCVLPGTIYADRVIVQSEKIRRKYIQVFKEWSNSDSGIAKKSPLWKKIENPEKKFLALGSPKFDKVINSCADDFTLPGKWRELIEKPDGTRKKIVLYNTTITPILGGNRKYIEKLKKVLALFEKRDDIVLWWRPHPLSVAAYSSMRPQFVEEYEQIIADYRHGEWGIYDDTPDLHRAIAVSDAYYGDGGSLLALYQCTGKPIMQQNIHILQTNDDFGTLSFINLYDDGDCFWVTAHKFNALFKIDKQSLKMKYMGRFPSETAYAYLYSAIIKRNEKLYFAPLVAKDIAVYDITTRQYEKISIKNANHKNEPGNSITYKFWVAAEYKNYIFFIGWQYPAIIRYDTENNRLDYFTDWVESVNKMSDGDCTYFFDCCVTGNILALPAYCANAVVLFDMDTCVSSIYEVGSKGCKYSSICYDGKYYWLAPRLAGPVVRWDADTKEYKEYNHFPAGFKSKDISFMKMVYSNGYIWLFPAIANMVLKINPEDGNMVIAKEFQSECSYEINPYNFNYIMAKVYDGFLYAYAHKSGTLIRYNYKTQQLRKESMVLSEEYRELFRLHSYSKVPEWDMFLTEGEQNFGLEGFLHYINLPHQKTMNPGAKETGLRSHLANSNGSAGKEIYAYCKKVLLLD